MFIIYTLFFPRAILKVRSVNILSRRNLSSCSFLHIKKTMAPGENRHIHKPIHRAWWKESSVYQIWPASFKDSNHDGIGDIPGIVSKLDHIQKLGADIVWLSPSYKSPQVDMGYDIADYYSIDPQYGTVKDVEDLIAGCHERDMKLLMDLVVNHTSDQHEWFQKSRSSKDNEYRNWYVWRPAKYDAKGNRHPPNNWVSHFQGQPRIRHFLFLLIF